MLAGLVVSSEKIRAKHNDEPVPKFYFYFCALNALLVLVAACIYPSASESHGIIGHDDHHGNEGHGHGHQELTLKEKLSLCLKVLKYRRVKKVIQYLVIVTLTFPNYEVFIIYSNEN